MVKDLLDSYGKYFKDNKVVLDSYLLQNGAYYLFSKEGEFLNKLVVDNNTEVTLNIYEYFKVRDYYSNYLDANKAIENKVKEKVDGIEYNMAKKIASNNYLTLFFKNKFIYGINGEEHLKEEIPVQVFKSGISGYFNSLLEIGENAKKGEKEILEIVEDISAEKGKIKEGEVAIQKAFDYCIEDLKNSEPLKKDTWIKIFIEADEEEYEKASNKYLYLKLFNTNDRNYFNGQDVYGVNNYNYGLNSKKPYLELKTTEYLNTKLSFEEVKTIRNLYTWLLKNKSKSRYTILEQNFNFEGKKAEVDEINNKPVYLFRVINDNGKAHIEDFELIPNYNTTIRKYTCKDYLNGTNEKISYSTSKIDEMQAFISQKVFSKYLEASYFTFKDSVSKSKIPEWKKNALENYSNVFKMLFIYQDMKPLENKLNEIFEYLTINSLRNEKIENKAITLFNTRDIMNIWISLDEYIFEGKEGMYMKIFEAINNSKNIIKEQGKVEDDKTYYALVGQVGYYIVSQTKGNLPAHDLLDPILKAKNTRVLKENMAYLYEKYNFEFGLRDSRFNNALANVMEYEPETSIKDNMPILLAGICKDNVFYEKKEKDNIIKEEE